MGKTKSKGGSLEYVILGVTADEYELPLCLYTSYEQLAKRFGISKSSAYSMVSRGSKNRKTKLKYELVIMEGTE